MLKFEFRSRFYFLCQNDLFSQNRKSKERQNLHRRISDKSDSPNSDSSRNELLQLVLLLRSRFINKIQ